MCALQGKDAFYIERQAGTHSRLDWLRPQLRKIASRVRQPILPSNGTALEVYHQPIALGRNLRTTTLKYASKPVMHMHLGSLSTLITDFRIQNSFSLLLSSRLCLVSGSRSCRVERGTSLASDLRHERLLKFDL